jgi:hypothetical protein
MNGATLLILVGPSEEDLQRLLDLLDSVVCYESEGVDCVLIDDGPDDRTSRLTALVGGRLPVTVVRHPRGDRTGPWGGASTAGILSGIAALQDRRDLDFVLKIDVDALVIGPFRQQLSAFLGAHPDAGLVGCVGETCDRAAPQFQHCLRRPSPFTIALELMAALPRERIDSRETLSVAHPAMRAVEVTAEERQAVLALRPRMEQAAMNGMRTAEYCQGGAYAIAFELIRRMKAASMLDDAPQWLRIGFASEDETLAMYCYAAGLRIHDFSNEQEPFGIRWRGLAFEPAQFVARGSAIIHSVKRDERHAEPDIRAFFARRRDERCAAGRTGP